MIEITSKSNEHFKRWSELSSSRGVKKHHEFILMGNKLIEEFLASSSRQEFKIKAELVNEDLPALFAGRGSERVSVFKLSKALFNELDVVGTHFNLLVLEAKPLPSLPAKHSAQGLELICPLGDPGNLGALARSALAFGVSKLILTEESCSPYHPKAMKASAGALLRLPLFKVEKFADYVAAHENIFALDMKGENVARFPWPANLQLVIGEEGPGFGDLKGLQRLSVPTQNVESLNATVAASIALFTYANFQTHLKSK
ncbi:MAG TPA: RNA methyltransferase [Bdellovibrio sp.]|nr:RNA methyltransferase [Bdellovibrio sp.]